MKSFWFIVWVSLYFCCVNAWGTDEMPWYVRMRVGMEVGPTGAQFGYSDPSDARYCAHFDGAEIVRQCVAANSEYLVMWARDGDYAYYDSTLLRKAPGLGDRDPLREAIEAARPYKLPVIAYCVVQQGGHYLKEHPQFAMQDINGMPLGRFCYNSGYLESMKAIVAEQLAYGIAGFHMDMLDQGFGPPYGCWCATCQKEYHATYGRPMPSKISWDEEWDHFLDFRYNSSARFMRELYVYIKTLNPEATVDFNYHGNPPFSFEVGQRPVQHATLADFVTGETGVWGFSALTVGLNAAFYQAATPGKPVQVAMQRGVRMYHDQTTRPLADLRWELLTLLAHGAFVTVVDKTGFDGKLDPVAYDRIGKTLEEVHLKQNHFGQPMVADVGLYFSHRTRDWVGRETPGKYFIAFYGAHKTMVYHHIPWGVVLDENVTLETLKSFPVIVLPNTGIVNSNEIDLLTTYVSEGGHLIVTGLSGCYDRMGIPRTSSALESLIGARLKTILDTEDNWVRLSYEVPEVLRDTIPNDWPFLVKGPAAVYETVSAQSFGELIRPHRTIRQAQGFEGTEWPMSPDVSVGPALLLNRVGKGVVLTLAGSPDVAAASEHHIREARQLLHNAVKFLHPAPRVQIEAPVFIQSVVTDDTASQTLRVHF